MAKDHNWKEMFQTFVHSCQEELKKTTHIGKKMLTASKVSTDLNDHYKELGILVAKDLEKKNLKWDNPEAKEHIELIGSLKVELEKIDKEVEEIKAQQEKEAGPENDQKSEAPLSQSEDKSDSLKSKVVDEMDNK